MVVFHTERWAGRNPVSPAELALVAAGVSTAGAVVGASVGAMVGSAVGTGADVAVAGAGVGEGAALQPTIAAITPNVAIRLTRWSMREIVAAAATLVL